MKFPSRVKLVLGLAAAAAVSAMAVLVAAGLLRAPWPYDASPTGRDASADKASLDMQPVPEQPPATPPVARVP